MSLAALRGSLPRVGNALQGVLKTSGGAGLLGGAVGYMAGTLGISEENARRYVWAALALGTVYVVGQLLDVGVEV